jgi:hypothetical protein
MSSHPRSRTLVLDLDAAKESISRVGHGGRLTCAVTGPDAAAIRSYVSHLGHRWPALSCKVGDRGDAEPPRRLLNRVRPTRSRSARAVGR